MKDGGWLVGYSNVKCRDWLVGVRSERKGKKGGGTNSVLLEYYCVPSLPVAQSPDIVPIYCGHGISRQADVP